ncbi:MAG: hypothetical protein WCF20_00880 [Methylovirgula sp.]
MQTSIFIAKLLGPIYVVGGIAFLFKPQAFRVLHQEFIESHVLMYLAGVLGLLGGLALVLTHNVWVLDWRLVITLIGWVTIIRAIVTIFQPQQIASIGSKLLEHRGIFFGAAVMTLVIGLVLSYFGYSA